MLPVKIPVSGKPMFSIEEIKTIPETVVPGSTVKLTAKIKNVGTKEADSVSLRAFKESSQPFDFEEKSDFIGKLEPGETGEAVLTFDVDKDAAVKKYILDMEIRSVYNDEVLTENEVVDLTVQKASKSGTLGIVIAIIVVIVLIVVLIVYKSRKKKKSKAR